MPPDRAATATKETEYRATAAWMPGPVGKGAEGRFAYAALMTPMVGSCSTSISFGLEVRLYRGYVKYTS